jgi:putative transferase (TIGR04331 family)
MDFGVRHRERLQALSPNARFEGREVPFARRLRSAGLAVFDFPSTPMLEAMAADVPCVMSWDSASVRFRPEAVPFVDRLRQQGILFERPEDAAAQIGRVDADPRAWWDEPERREAHRAFTRTFALATEDWSSAWLKEIREEAR